MEQHVQEAADTASTPPPSLPPASPLPLGESSQSVLRPADPPHAWGHADNLFVTRSTNVPPRGRHSHYLQDVHTPSISRADRPIHQGFSALGAPGRMATRVPHPASPGLVRALEAARRCRCSPRPRALPRVCPVRAAARPAPSVRPATPRPARSVPAARGQPGIGRHVPAGGIPPPPWALRWPCAPTFTRDSAAGASRQGSHSHLRPRGWPRLFPAAPPTLAGACVARRMPRNDPSPVGRDTRPREHLTAAWPPEIAPPQPPSLPPLPRRPPEARPTPGGGPGSAQIRCASPGVQCAGGGDHERGSGSGLMQGQGQGQGLGQSFPASWTYKTDGASSSMQPPSHTRPSPAPSPHPSAPARPESSVLRDLDGNLCGRKPEAPSILARRVGLARAVRASADQREAPATKTDWPSTTTTATALQPHHYHP
ncbi:nascent polypeptide-associated complex subunit alpha, muscle-specific form-like [Eriocheir sinensis]|uniref:nascent polypeptide-associated complex subunit alpha, muscle-specific form-like n=1 Tax=Eriocheir sinensis TaxID=95602 RepID=UPI0021C94C1A|nr:nascent polypeptide-associated complex subunit alpha, muscle-specific form-like [Eriocheir sinensis]